MILTERISLKSPKFPEFFLFCDYLSWIFLTSIAPFWMCKIKPKITKKLSFFHFVSVCF